MFNFLNKNWSIIKEYSILLIIGSILALVLVNTLPELYIKITHFSFFKSEFIGHHHDGYYDFSLAFLVNEVLMTFFFAVAAKEVWEAIALKGGSLRGRQAISTVIATFGGILGPVLIYLLISVLFGNFANLKSGWAIPTATDIAFAYLVGKLIFGKNHPAIGFLLALAILDDAMGLIILAIFYPSGHLQPFWLLLSIFISIFVYLIFNFLPNKSNNKNFALFTKKIGTWPYMIAGFISWYGFFKAGVHPVLSFIPIILTIPHSETDLGIFSKLEDSKEDLLNKFEHKLQILNPFILMAFGFVNAGVVLSSVNDATWAVLGGLLVGKPLGILICGFIAARFFGLPKGMSIKDLPVLGAVAGIGFTVSLFVSIQAFPIGEIQEGAKMGALLSFLALIIALILAKIFKIKKIS